jgi:hypothetical protein
VPVVLLIQNCNENNISNRETELLKTDIERVHADKSLKYHIYSVTFQSAFQGVSPRKKHS